MYVHRLLLLLLGFVTGASAFAAGQANSSLEILEQGWREPARTYRNHTRWWWPGNALTPDDITRQLESMAAQGLGGVEVMNTSRMYEKGNHDYLSPHFFTLARHAVGEARRLGMSVSFTFGPGWSFGGPWVPPEDQSRALVMGAIDFNGAEFSGELPHPAPTGGRPDPPRRDLPRAGKIVAIVAGRLTESKLAPESLMALPLPSAGDGAAYRWSAPAPGAWRLMAFWLRPTGQQNQEQDSDPPAMIVDHLNPAAVQRYVETLGGMFEQQLGDEFGRTIETFFCDSFEIYAPARGILWSHDTLARFKAFSGYELTPFLPSLWFDLGALSIRVRYDVGVFLQELGIEAVFKPFNAWCERHGMKARIQPHYRFMPELVRGAGAAAIPETEFNTARFATIPDPRKSTASGARFYGREFVSAEAFTFMHDTRYRTTLAELKIAADAFLRDGVTRFYNHGYFASPEAEVAPSRDMPWGNSLNHWDTIWPYYRHFSSYLERSCFLLRQGRLVADILLYTPQNTVWSQRVFWGHSRRMMPYGDLAQTLLANGYDYDIVNDDLLQNHATIEGGAFHLNGHRRRILILPKALIVPVATMQRIAEFAQNGGTVIALEALPIVGGGLLNFRRNDEQLRQLVSAVFTQGPGHFIPEYSLDGPDPSPRSKPWAPMPSPRREQQKLLQIIGRTALPDFALAGERQSDGLTFQHRQLEGIDLFFVTNLQPRPHRGEVTFRISGRQVLKWDARTGKRTAFPIARDDGRRTTLDLDLAEWESAFFLFVPDVPVGIPAEPRLAAASSVPIAGPWRLTLEGTGAPAAATTLRKLQSWNDSSQTRHFSGTGVYTTEFAFAPSGAAGARQILDLGSVGSIAEVAVNGIAVGVAWMPPYHIEVTDALQPGNNRLTVRVTNSLINRVAGMKAPPEVPDHLRARLGRTHPDYDSPARLIALEQEQRDLPPAGLLGPVELKTLTPRRR